MPNKTGCRTETIKRRDKQGEEKIVSDNKKMRGERKLNEEGTRRGKKKEKRKRRGGDTRICKKTSR